MKRKDFIRRTLLTSAGLSLLRQDASRPGECIKTPSETEGPFPTHQPSTLSIQNIVADRSGVPLIINIAINNISNKCAGLAKAIVDIWHCDNKGEYSEYGGVNEHGFRGGPSKRPSAPPTLKNDSLKMKQERRMPPQGSGPGMQSTDYTKQHFLRGRQTADSKGLVYFQSIYPGWYPGRSPHIHVHVFNESGKSLLVTQIAFPDHISSEVYKHEAYVKHGQPDTDNASDNVFNDSIANELATITGNINDGYVLTHSIFVKA